MNDKEPFEEVKEKLLIENSPRTKGNFSLYQSQSPQNIKVKPEEVFKLHVYDFQTKTTENLYLRNIRHTKNEYDIGSLNGSIH